MKLVSIYREDISNADFTGEIFHPREIFPRTARIPSSILAVPRREINKILFRRRCKRNGIIIALERIRIHLLTLSFLNRVSTIFNIVRYKPFLLLGCKNIVRSCIWNEPGIDSKHLFIIRSNFLALKSFNCKNRRFPRIYLFEIHVQSKT